MAMTRIDMYSVAGGIGGADVAFVGNGVLVVSVEVAELFGLGWRKVTVVVEAGREVVLMLKTVVKLVVVCSILERLVVALSVPALAVIVIGWALVGEGCEHSVVVDEKIHGLRVECPLLAFSLHRWKVSIIIATVDYRHGQGEQTVELLIRYLMNVSQADPA